MPLKPGVLPPAGVACDVVVQPLPFQRSPPSVMQAFAAVQEIALPPFVGVGMIDQARPFHRSASGARPLLVPYRPIAVHVFVAEHETP